LTLAVQCSTLLRVKTCVIFNPAARGNKARQFRDQLAQLSTEVALKPTYAPGAGRLLASQAVREGFETLVAAGGDGTLNEVLNGIGDVPEGFARTRLGILPLGTINVFAREIGLPLSFEPAWAALQRGRESLVDVPEVEFTINGAPSRRLFAQLAGAGLDSRAIELVDWEQKKAVGPLAYVVAGFKALAESKTTIVASAPNTTSQGELVLIGNGRYYGGHFKLFPAADLRDGLLDVTVFPRVNWETLLRSGWGWLTDQLHSSAGCQTFQADSVTLTSESPVALQLDGDNVGHLPARFSVRRQLLRVVIP
jgi:diacylglycerol kinase (ATP)